MRKKITDYLNEFNIKNNKKDIISIIFLITIYSIISFYNLGSFKNPQTFYNAKKNEELIFNVDKNIKVIRLFNGRINGKYHIEILDKNNKITNTKEINGNGAFSWNEEKFIKTTKIIKIQNKIKNASIGTIAFFDKNNKIINIKDVSSSNKSAKNINNIIDEPENTPSNISINNTSYFDEIYFARSAYEYATNNTVSEWTHPPLGKLIQSIPIIISKKMTPFYYRLMGNIAGIIMILVMYNFGKLLFKKRKYALISSSLLLLDNFHLAQTRIGTSDGLLVLFILLSYYYMCKYFDNNKTRDLLLCGIMFGCSISTKWIGCYSGLGLAILFFTYTLSNKKLTIKLISKCILFFIIIPLSIYISSYLIYPNFDNNKTNNISSIIKQQQNMYSFHSKLIKKHDYSSKWYTWPICKKPLWYYVDYVDNQHKAVVVTIGNIIIWWTGILTFFITLYLYIKKRKFEKLILLIAILSLFLPFSIIKRPMFIYHYFSILPFIILTIVSVIKDMEKYKLINFITTSYLLLVLINFIKYYPISVGIPMSNDYINKLKLFSSWIFQIIFKK